MEENTNTMKIIKRDGECVDFDITKICEAISKALIDLFAGVGEIVKDIVEAASTSFYSALHSLCHWLMHGFWNRKRKEKHSGISHAIIKAAILLPSVISTTTTFCSYSRLLRNVYLLRTQDRCSDDSANADDYWYIALLTV